MIPVYTAMIKITDFYISDEQIAYPYRCMNDRCARLRHECTQQDFTEKNRPIMTI